MRREQKEEEEEREGGGVPNPTMHMSSVGEVQEVNSLVPPWCRGVSLRTLAPTSRHVAAFIPYLAAAR